MADPYIWDPNSQSTLAGFGRSRPSSPLRILLIGGLGSVFFDAVRFVPPFFSGRLPTWDDNIGRQAHLPMLVGVAVFCIVAYALLAGLWVKAVGRAGEDVT